MNPLVYHLVSGQSFYTGILLILAGVSASMSPRPLARRLAILFCALGTIAVLCSSTAIPYWADLLCGSATLFWLLSIHGKWLRTTSYLMFATWTGAALLDLPYQFFPVLSPVTQRAVTIIGDSVTAGLGENEATTWPQLLAAEHLLEVQDVSHVGETAASALKRIAGQEIAAPIVIVEIGGNDILGSTSPSQFEHDLDLLLARIAVPERQIVMFELPLPPFFHEYGRIQRKLAWKHHVQLIPKRIFLSILAGGNATLDSIHLSQAGHQRMADDVWRLIGDAYSPQE